MRNDVLWRLPERFAALAAQYPDLTPGRVLSQEKEAYRVISARGEHSATVSGRFRYEAARLSDYPAVGDFVMLDVFSGGQQAVIHAVLPRKSVFIRKAAGTARTEQVVAANIDTVFLCMSLNNDFNLRRLERYLAVSWNSGATPVIVLTKADLCADIGEKLAAVESVSLGSDTLVTSSVEGGGTDCLTPYLAPGATVAFVGSSGAGKSTMINRLLGDGQIKTGGLRNDDKGRHTTTQRSLLLLPGGAMVIDTPGMRELGMWDSSEGVSAAFADIEELAAGCRFRNCTHTSEPGCAVREALRSGALDESRFASYRKLTAETAYAESSGSYLAAKEKKFKEIAKYNKTNRKK